MAAVDAFGSLTGALSQEHRKELEGLIRRRGEDLLEARSEDARVRILEEYRREIQEIPARRR
ncbi:MAG: hypothetical protein WB626_07380 [Bacteroidota bacterium]